MVYLDNYLVARNERLIKGKPKKPSQVIKGERRRHVIDDVMDILKDWRFSEFQHEASCRHGLRMAMVLEGHKWPVADLDAANIVSVALNMMGAERPLWEEGQREHTIGDDNCLWCGKELADELTTGGRKARFCDGICARSHLTYRDFATVRSETRSHRQAYEVLSRERLPERSCVQCGSTYQPNRRHAETQKYCSKACASSAKLSYDRTERECPCCLRKFLPDAPGQRYCGQKCYAHSIRKHRARNCKGCGNTFTPYNSAMVFCSSNCFHSQREEKTCEFCAKAFQAKNSSAKYCGTSCRDRAVIKRAIEAAGGTYRPAGSMWQATCECCHTGFLTKSHRAKTCSFTCREELRAGVKKTNVVQFFPITAAVFDSWFRIAA